MGESTFQGMKCPRCGYSGSRCIDSRASEDGHRRRRQQCIKCRKRFTTYEITEDRYGELTSLSLDLDIVSEARIALSRIEKKLRRQK